MIRMAKTKDKKAFIDLWRICFEDSPAFVDWFFENRFFPEYSACVEIDGVLVAAMQSMPLPLWVRGMSVPGAIVVAVCTHPDFRGRHLMKNMFAFYMHQMREKKILAITYKPENIPTYFSLGHYPTTRTLHYTAAPYPREPGVSGRIPSSESGYKSSMRVSAVTELSERDLRACFDLYSSIAPSYSGMVDRDEGLFLLKSNDYASDGAKAVLCFDKSLPGSQPRLVGYCFFYDTEEELYGEEFLAKDIAAASRMIRSLRSLPGGKPVGVKIPPDFAGRVQGMLDEAASEAILEAAAGALPDAAPAAISSPVRIGFAGGEASLSPQNVTGVTDIAEFIRKLDLSRFADHVLLSGLVIGVRDLIVEENNLSLNLLGEVTASTPCLTIGIGYLVQALCGYSRIMDFETKKDNTGQTAGPLVIEDAAKADRVNQILCRTDCFIVDEY
jgi:hypothetical protein